MKLLVPVKRVVDYSVRIRVRSDNSAVDTTGLKMSINPFDEIAVEEAVRLKEKQIASEVIVVTIGESKCQETLRAALALGADRAIHIETDEEMQPLAVARLLAKITEQEAPGLIIMGKQAIDGDNNQTGQMLAGLLGWPQGTFASRLAIDHDKIEVTREVDGGLMTLSLHLPAVVTTDLRLNTPRYAALPNIMKARSKPLTTITPASLGVDIAPRMKITAVEEPKKRSGGKKLGSVAELIAVLKTTGIL